jgi:deoxyribodipyrimidine photo-lyase
VTAIVWFRRDLRVHDHPALHAALESAETVVPVFCFDDALLRGRHASGPRTQFLLECLGELDAQLRDRGSQLIVRRGTPERELPALAESVGAGAVHLSADAGPFARRRQREVRQALGSRVQFCVHPGLFVVDRLDAIRTRDGGPYTVFTPFERNWSTRPRREVLAAPRGLPALPSGVDVGTLPTLADLGLAQECAEPARGGEGPGREVLARFLAGPVRGYD